MSLLRDQIQCEFRRKLITHGVLGTFSKTTDSSIVEAAGHAGLDFIILDMEHGPINLETLKHHVMAAELSGISPIVRVDAYNSSNIEKALDLGAHGIQASSINNAEQVEELIQKMKFHPLGERGLCRFVRASAYSTEDRFAYLEKSNLNQVIIQIEGTEGIQNIDQILKVKGVDVIFIGPYDLSQNLGLPGQIEHPDVLKEIESIKAKADAVGVQLGTFCDSPNQLKKYIDMGMHYLAYSVDIALFVQKLQDLISIEQEWKNKK